MTKIATATTQLELATQILNDLDQAGIETTMIGGMALVTLGSLRVTQDYDFLVDKKFREQRELVTIFYRYGFEFVSKMEKGNILRTVDNQNVAFSKIQIDQPTTAFFYKHDIGLRMDVLFDFPYSAADVHARATKKKVEGTTIHVASIDDLIRMKELAYADRKKSTDLQDLEFLRSLQK